MTAAIYFHPEAYTTTGPKLMGRNAAGESFLERRRTRGAEKKGSDPFIDSLLTTGNWRW
ncbi:MAG: hypothetical protein ACK4N4_01105 [Burkholderiales bacterium]